MTVSQSITKALRSALKPLERSHSTEELIAALMLEIERLETEA